MVRVEEAEKIILKECKDFGTELIPFDNCLGRVLAENIIADRDFPAFDRVTMDGVAINYNAFKNGERSFRIKAIQSAGEEPIEISSYNECIEIMTGAVLPSTTDTVIPYEGIEINNGVVTIKTDIVSIHQNIHPKGKDRRQNELLIEANQFIIPTIIAVAATVGKTSLLVKKNPAIIIISTGDELIEINEIPTSFQIRRSNNYTLRAALQQQGLGADMLHLPDDQNIITQKLKYCIKNYDIILLSGGVSMGKFDYVPSALENLQVRPIFHKVQQRPGKPFWFGSHETGALVFAFPGNPVSTFMCFYRYFLPWLRASWQVKTNKHFAVLNEDFTFKASLQYFLQVKLQNNQNGELHATPMEGNGSGDFVNLLQADAFMELPLERVDFKKGEVFPVWIFKQIP